MISSTQKYVAVKIGVSKNAEQDREHTMLKLLGAVDTDKSHHHNLVTMLDSFQLSGPNGRHNCNGP